MNRHKGRGWFLRDWTQRDETVIGDRRGQEGGGCAPDFSMTDIFRYAFYAVHVAARYGPDNIHHKKRPSVFLSRELATAVGFFILFAPPRWGQCRSGLAV